MNEHIRVGGDAQFKKYQREIIACAEKTLLFFKKKGSLAIFLVGNRTMKKNVLSFPATTEFPHPDMREPFLGDIYLNPHFILKEGDSVQYMLVHGILHLLGYDHMETRDRIQMERKEKQVLFFIKKIK